MFKAFAVGAIRSELDEKSKSFRFHPKIHANGRYSTNEGFLLTMDTRVHTYAPFPSETQASRFLCLAEHRFHSPARVHFSYSCFLDQLQVATIITLNASTVSRAATPDNLFRALNATIVTDLTKATQSNVSRHKPCTSQFRGWPLSVWRSCSSPIALT